MMIAMMAEDIQVGPLAIRFLIDAEASSGSATAFEFTVPAGSRVPVPHSHDAYEETIYGLDGELTWTVDGEEIAVAPGQAICIPRGVVHGFENRGTVDARALAVVTPGVLGPEYFRDLRAVVAAAAGPPDPAAIAEVMQRHGLTPAV
jgi:quercetin dioxygenase-like cupin family protein